jgi:arylsulfatase A-like enzyme
LFIFTSDNGGLHVPELRHEVITHNSPFRAGKGSVYEGGLRIPLLARWPGKIAPNRVIETPVIGTDWTPTLSAIAGRLAPEIDGVNITPLLTGGTIPARSLLWHFPHYTNQGGQPAGAIREGDWKLIEHYEDSRMELFNLRNDAGEARNLAEREPARAASMKEALHAWLRRSDAQMNTTNPNFDPSLHRQLYVEVEPSKFNAARATPDEKKKILEWRKRMDAVVKKKE